MRWAFLVIILLTGCASAKSLPQPLTPTGVVTFSIASQGCGRVPAVAPGSSADQTIAAVPALARGNATRSFRLHVPVGYSPSHPQAVVLVFHGYGSNAAAIEKDTGFSPLADQQDFLVLYPQALADDFQHPLWASIGPIDYKIDDVRFVSDLLNAVQSLYCVDPRRIFATGFSNGGGMTALLACRLSQRIAAFAPVSGNYYAIPGGCHPAHPASILEFHGTADPILPYDGVPYRDNPAFPLPAIPAWLSAWAQRDGCKGEPITFLQDPPVTGIQWSDCRGNAVVAHYRIEGGGHGFPPTIKDTPFTMVIWRFFQDHPLPSSH